MDVRNPKYNHVGSIDCEINHPSFGWIPFTANPNDVEPLGVEIYTMAVAGEFGAIAQYVAPLPTLEDYDAALTAHLDSVAQSKRYADRISCSVRAGYPGPFQSEGIAFATWMDTCNQIGYQILADFQAGNIPQPSVEDVIAALPQMVWPVT